MSPEQLTAIEMTSPDIKCRPPGVERSRQELAACINQVKPFGS